MLAVAQKGYCLPIIEKDIKTSGALNTCEICNEFIIGFNMEIIGMSEDMRHKIEEAIITAKKKYFEKYNEDYPIPEWKKNEKWCSNGFDSIEFDFLALDIDIGRNGITYHIDGGFHDIEDDLLEANISIPLNLSKYNGLVKNLIHRYIDDTYFRNC